MSYIEIQNLTFGYEGSSTNVFENAGVRLDTDWKIGFTGRNGRGKTTLLKLLMGELPYQGKIYASEPFRYFPFQVEEPEQLCFYVAEAILPDLELWRLERELNLLGVEGEILYRPFSTLSGGEQTKLLLALLFLQEHCFLLIDEPTNHLDLTGRKKVAEYLNKKKGFLLVSHDRAFLDGCADHMLAIQNTGFSVEKGTFSSWFENRERQLAFESAENEKLKKEAARLGAAVRQTSGWSDKLEKTKRGGRNSGLRPDRGYIGHKSAKMMKRAKTIAGRREAALAEKEKLLKNVEKQEPLKLHPLEYRSTLLLSARDLSLFYEDKRVCSGLRFEICRGDRAAVVGPNGCGKTTLLKLVAGESIAYKGGFIRPGDLKVSFLPQDTAGLSGSLEGFAEQREINGTLFKTILRKLDFTREQFERPIESYSLGQKKKVAVAASLCESAHLYIWDEPLNYIDVISRMQIEALLKEYQPTVLFVEHDLAFMEKIATKRICL